MRIELETQGDFCVLRLKGRFSTGSREDFVGTRDRLQAAGARKVLLDCAELPYIDSTGLGFVVGLYTSLTNVGGHLALTNVSDRIRDVLGMVRLRDIIPLYRTEQEAIAALTAKASAATGAAD